MPRAPWEGAGPWWRRDLTERWLERAAEYEREGVGMVLTERGARRATGGALGVAARRRRCVLDTTAEDVEASMQGLVRWIDEQRRLRDEGRLPLSGRWWD